MDQDEVNHPSHYTSHPSGVECITITRHLNFNIGNAFKYLWRAGRKPYANQTTDLRKAAWYIQDEINRLEQEQENERQQELFDNQTQKNVRSEIGDRVVTCAACGYDLNNGLNVATKGHGVGCPYIPGVEAGEAG